MMRPPAIVAPHDPILRARAQLGRGRYLVGAGGHDPTAPSPDSVVRGRRGCDYAGFLAWCLGYSRRQRGFTSSSDWINADTMIEEAETRALWFLPIAEPEPGAILAYCSISLDRDGQRDRLGHAALITSRPTRWTLADSSWSALRIIHCSPSIQRRHRHAIAETHAASWAHRASFRGISHPHWRARFLRYLQRAI